ncbi:type II toxin-antitoxin system prevent-host-death family antitoxin [Nocardia sp. NPDC050710]|uniref:type II toxin-antitoxin system Phd/YefM family antitoxin n=1 Tax=Nocardia sp. NPDC050710 TaxID=3157220 RepID=UPI00340533BF
MKPMNYTEARANLASVLDSATEDLEEVVVTRAGHEPAVVVALSEYEALKETAYLLGNPANARHLERSIAEHRGGEAMPRELVDIDEDEDGEEATPRRKKVRIYRPASPDAAFSMGDLRDLLYIAGLKGTDFADADRVEDFVERLREAASVAKPKGKTTGPKAAK